MIMFAQDETADVFAIPDFWEPPQWELPKDDNGFFALELNGGFYQKQSLSLSDQYVL